jgi:replicative DNA helicase
MDGDARRLAEQATVGGLLLQPAAVGVVEQWLRRSDFTQAWLGDLYLLLRERHHAGEAGDPLSVGRALIAGRSPSTQMIVPRLVDLLQAAPVPPEPLAYARVVLASGIRREVEGLGVVLRAGAMAAARQLDAGPMRQTAAEVDGLLREARERWDRAHGRTGAMAPPVEDSRRGLDLRLGADRFLQAQPSVADAEVAERERRLVGALVVRPAAAAAIGQSLHPEWLTERTLAAAYAAILDLTATQQPVDAVTVCCRARELSAAFGVAPSAREVVAAAEESLTTDPFRAAAAVSADVTVRTAQSAAASLSAAAQRPGLGVPDLLDTAHVLVTATVSAAAGMRPAGRGWRGQDVAAAMRARTVGGVAG